MFIPIKMMAHGFSSVMFSIKIEMMLYSEMI